MKNEQANKIARLKYRNMIERADEDQMARLEARRQRSRESERNRIMERRLALYERQPGCWYCLGVAPERFLVIEDIDPARKCSKHYYTDMSNQALSCISCNSLKKNKNECVYGLLDLLEEREIIKPDMKYRIIDTLFFDKVIHTTKPDHWEK